MTESIAHLQHASCVAIDGRGVLLTGASGSGKSGLALALIGVGAVLVADDRTMLQVQGQSVLASVPETIAGMIEARGVGILRVPHADRVPVRCVVDLDREEKARLPKPQSVSLLGQRVPLLCKVNAAHFPVAILHYVKALSQEH